jgi:hypothetical protein
MASDNKFTANNLVRRSVLMEITGGSYLEINIGIMCLVASHISRSYFENQRPGARSILQVMSVGVASKEGGAIARAQDFLTPFCNEHNLPLQNVDELLRQSVPMPLTGPGSRCQFQEVYANVLKSCRYRQSTSNFVLTRRGKRFWISGTG